MGLMNALFIAGVPIHPALKPGKMAQAIESYRPVSLLAALLKLFDRLMYGRLKARLEAAESPWQGGGHEGADCRSWLASEIVQIWIAEHPGKKLFAAFLDAESAFCRPHWAYVLEACADAGATPAELRGIKHYLTCIGGIVRVGQKNLGLWQAATGLPQGGAFSSKLFQAVLNKLQKSLAAAGLGVRIAKASGELVSVACLGYADDLILLAESASELQRALDIAYQWSCEMRLTWNVGPNKSAVMVFGN